MRLQITWCCLLTAGCLTVQPSMAQVKPSPSTAASDGVVDQRPPNEGKQHTLSLAIWNCEYMVTRVSDKGMPVDRIQQLRAEISSLKLQPGDQILVTRYAVFMNEGSQMVESALAVAAGANGGVLIGGGGGSTPRCSRERMSAGWFDPSEATTKRPPIIAEVSVRFRGKEYSARAAYAPEIGTYYYPRNPRQLADRIALYSKVNNIIMDQIKQDLANAAP